MKTVKSKLAVLLSLVMVSQMAVAAVSPSASRYDPRNQNVIYNPDNTTAINSASGYVTTLVFDEDERVIETETGFPAGWSVKKSDNRVYIRVKPVTQKIAIKNADGEDQVAQKVIDPETDLERWRTNLFIVTTKRNFSIELNARTMNKPEKIAYVVNYRFPAEKRKQQAEIEKQRMQEYQKRQETQRINQSLANAKVPRNWNYWQRVAKGSSYIKPAYVYDDGRTTYFGFNPVQKVPSLFVQFGDQEMVTNPSVQQKGDFTVVAVNQLSDKWVLRLGNQVVGVENKGYGKVRLPSGTTVSPDVEKEVVE
ncbi:TrbG/VirB9 family P-type conjugative transfer protein [Salmonella enterica]|nr:TrbG/VirB9 family P-type conjugative transfer protein [Salmonella enterica]